MVVWVWHAGKKLLWPSFMKKACKYHSQLVRMDTDGGIASITLCNPSKANPLSVMVMKDIINMLDVIHRDSAIRCTVLRHEGTWVSSGHDIRDLFDKANNWSARPRSQLQETFQTCSELNVKLKYLQKPTVAIVKGHASAGGAQLVASCDIVIAAPRAQFSTPGSQRGRFCHTPAVSIMERVGSKKALELLLLGSSWSAEEAKQAGLVNFVFPEEFLEEKAADILQTLALASRNIQIGKVGFLKQLEGTHTGIGIEERYRLAEQLMVDMFCTPDAAEGTRAMIEKRNPEWIGSRSK